MSGSNTYLDKSSADDAGYSADKDYMGTLPLE